MVKPRVSFGKIDLPRGYVVKPLFKGEISPFTVVKKGAFFSPVVYWLLDSVTSAPQCIRQTRPRVYLKEGTLK